jgi:polynucleotide 5'-hydroxyl-kinase GRC3/NOL9
MKAPHGPIAIDRSLQALLKDLLKDPGTAIVIGATDAGKSTLIKFLIRGLLENKCKVCLVDADVGQSSLGLPGTISKKVFRNLKDLEKFKPDEMFFAGVTNPAMNFAGVLQGTKEMAGSCEKKKMPYTLIDTTGLVAGEIGKALKLAKIRLVNPGHVIAIERKDELEHILKFLKPTPALKVHRLRPSKMVKPRTAPQRAAYREEKFREYFKRAGVLRVDLKNIKLFYRGKEFTGGAEVIPKGAVVGLAEGARTLALGTFKGVEHRRALVKTPLASAEKVDRLLIGDIIFEDHHEGV